MYSEGTQAAQRIKFRHCSQSYTEFNSDYKKLQTKKQTRRYDYIESILNQQSWHLDLVPERGIVQLAHTDSNYMTIHKSMLKYRSYDSIIAKIPLWTEPLTYMFKLILQLWPS